MLSNRLLRLPLLVLVLCALFSSVASAVDTPRDLRGTEIRQNTVKWEWSEVSGAVQYEVTVDGNDKGPTLDTKFFSYNLQPGEHLMYVTAIDGNGNKSSSTLQAKISVSSSFEFESHGRSTLVGSNEISGTTSGDKASTAAFQAPQNPRGYEYSSDDVRWEWDSVSDAIEYEVTVDGNYVGKTSNTSWESEDLWRGTHSMTVKAIKSDRSRSNQSETVKIEVTGNVSSGSDTPSTGSPGQVQGLGYEEYASNDVRWSWNVAAGASRYEVTVDGNVAGTTGSTEWVSEGLWTGTHSLTVKAIDSSGGKSVQSETLKITVTGSGSTSTSPPPEVQPSAPPPEQISGGDVNASKVKSFIDPASYSYSEVSNKSGYELVFSDEFNGTELNPYRWHSQLRWDGEWNGERYEYRVINGEEQFYVNVLSPDEEHQTDIVPVYNPFRFDGNRLAIKATRNPLKDREKTLTHGKLDDIARQQPFLSGAISTHKKFARKYGYFEARIKISDHVGSFPAFWLFHERRAYEGTQRTEIDIMENLGHAPQYVYNSFHFFKNVSSSYSGDANFIKPKPSGQIYTGIDYSDDYHVYAVEWEPGKITWFIDGVKSSELSHGEVDFEELYIMLNLAVGGNWTNFPANAGGLGRSSDERFPTWEDIANFNDPQLEIDYVRVYRRQ